MGKKYLDTKTYTLEASVMDVWENLEEEEQNFEAIVREGMKKLDPVGQEDGDMNNDGVENKTDDYLKNRRKAIGRAMKGKKNLKANYGMMKANYGMSEEVEEVLDEDGGLLGYFFRKKTGLKNPLNIRQAAADKLTGKIVDKVTGSDKKKKKDNKELDEGTKQVLAHGGKGQYKAVRDGSITKVMYKGKVVGTADFDSGADSFFASIKGVRGQKSFDDAQAMVNYFAKNKITEEVLDEADELDIGAKKDSDPNRSDAKSQRRIPRKKMGDGGAAADDLGGPKGMKPVSATGGKELDIAPGGSDKEIKNQSREIKNPAREIKNPAKEMKRGSGGYKPITGKEKPSGGYKSIGEAKQKPYVSSDSDGKHVMDASGKIVKTFKDMAAANAYLKKNYDKLMNESFEIQQYQEFKVQSMREALEEVWGK